MAIESNDVREAKTQVLHEICCDNYRRSHTGNLLVHRFVEIEGSNDDTESDIVDAIADLLHYAIDAGENFELIAQMALTHVLTERSL